MDQHESIDEPFDAHLRWLVRSRSNHRECYLVDLGENDLNGECQCKDFSVRYPRNLKIGKKYQCWHIQEAERRFLRWCKRKFKEEDQNL